MTLEEKLDLLCTRLTNLENENKILREENQLLKEKVDYLTNKLYGRSSEKTETIFDGQLSLFDEAEALEDKKSPEPDLREVQRHYRKKYKGQRAELLKDLPRIKRIAALEEIDRFCQTCSNELKPIGEEFVRTEIEFIPAKVRVIDHYRTSYECRACRKSNKPYIENSPMPYPVIAHSMASPSSIAWVAHQKFVNAIPLYRQEKEWELAGIKLKRATMANWLMIASRDWLTHIVDLLHKEMLKESHLHIDETSLQVMKEDNRKNTSKSYMWVYTTGSSSKRPIRIFEYKPSRQGIHPKNFLKGFSGYIHTDAYPGYNKVPNVIRCMCWAHLRRKFVDALPTDKKATKISLAGIGVDYCNKLFAIEDEISELNSSDRKTQRLEKELPILEAFWSWIDDLLRGNSILPKGKFATAISYAKNNQECFMNYLKDGNCVISNNVAENSIRPFTIGRKNWLFSGSPKGADASAIIYSLIETAKANGLVPYKYLNFILEDLPGTQFQQYPEFLEIYLPWSQEAQTTCR